MTERRRPATSPPRPERTRRIDGGFAFIPNRFLHDGFYAQLSHGERSLYLFFLLAADRTGTSFYSPDRICSIVGLELDDYLALRRCLIQKDLLALDGTIVQVLDLPPKPRRGSRSSS